jgi:hypothetical protein
MSDDLARRGRCLRLVLPCRCTAKRHDEHNRKKCHRVRTVFHKFAWSHFLSPPTPAETTLSEDNELADSLFHADPPVHNDLRHARLRALSAFLNGRCDDEFYSQGDGIPCAFLDR